MEHWLLRAALGTLPRPATACVPRARFHAGGRRPALVIGTTYDPATPYAWARRLTAQLGNARLLTMVGDGHTAFLNYSSCVQKAVLAYVETLELPAEGTECGNDLDPALAARLRSRVSVHRVPIPARISP